MKETISFWCFLFLCGCGIRGYHWAGAGDSSAGDVTHASDSGARVVVPNKVVVHTEARAQYGHHGAALLPDDRMTPGATLYTDTKKVCSTKWGKDERAVTEGMKEWVMYLYGVEKNQGVCKPIPHKNAKGKTIVPKSGCEIDHRISREVGGADVIANLWPQPYLTPQEYGAYRKDKLENFLHRQVCAGRMKLQDAQNELAGDWVESYEKHFGKGKDEQLALQDRR